MSSHRLVPALPHLAFLTPRSLPKASSLAGQVAVLDIAFASEGGGSSFEGVTMPFIRGLGPRLAAWVDHHDHERHSSFANDPRFVLATKAQHGACPEMVTADVVAAAGHVDTVAMHVDLDGIYSGAKWVLKGQEPYPGADADARAVDTRRGEPGNLASRIDRALRARFRDNDLKVAVMRYLVARTDDPDAWNQIEAAARLIDPLLDEARRIAGDYRVLQGVAYVRFDTQRPFDKTELLLLGQQVAPVAVVHTGGTLSIAADFESGFDFVQMFDMGGGMPTRVSVPESRLQEVMDKVAAAVAART
ncbi:MAG: hypothetical protein SF187_14700 [Deltaproteobacteria bacterium]|nr:hypothetical protein [Deltaproteobacteria bacterium]